MVRAPMMEPAATKVYGDRRAWHVSERTVWKKSLCISLVFRYVSPPSARCIVQAALHCFLTSRSIAQQVQVLHLAPRRHWELAGTPR